MKRILLVLVMVVSLAACSNKVQQRNDAEQTLTQQGVTVTHNIGNDTLVIPADLLFKVDQSTLTRKGHCILNNAVLYTATLVPANVRVTAYVDDIMSPSLNKNVTQNQARTVAGFLWRKGLTVKLMPVKYKGKGAKHPIASNATGTGMKKNRRIQIRIEPLSPDAAQNKMIK